MQREEAIALEAKQEAEVVFAEAAACHIATVDQYAAAGEKLVEIKRRWNEIEATRKELKEPSLEAGRRIDAFFKAPLDTLKRAEMAIKSAISVFDAEQTRKRLEAERVAREAAAKEQARLDEIARKKAEKAEAAGKFEKAEAIREAVPVVVAAPIAVEEAPKVAGVSFRENWKARVTDPNAVPREYMVVNETMLDKFAKATKGAIPVPGVEFYPERIVAAGGR